MALSLHTPGVAVDADANLVVVLVVLEFLILFIASCLRLLKVASVIARDYFCLTRLELLPLAVDSIAEERWKSGLVLLRHD